MKTGPALAVVLVMSPLMFPVRAGALEWEETTKSIEIASDDGRGMTRFAFTNNSNNILRIREISTSCGCTVVRPEKLKFAPGEKGVLPVFYSADGRSGTRTYRIMVTTEEAGQASYELQLVVNVRPSIDIKPRTLVWENGEERTAKTATVRIDPQADLKVTGAKPDRDLVSVALIQGSSPGQSELRITPTAENTIGQTRVKLTTEPKSKATIDGLLFVLLR